MNSPRPSYGFGISETPIGRAVRHSGGFAGISAEFMMFLDADYMWCCLSHYGDGTGPVSRKVSSLLERK